jgi:hypothetical protein
VRFGYENALAGSAVGWHWTLTVPLEQVKHCVVRGDNTQ